ENSGDARLQLGELRRIGLAVDLEVHEGFEPTFGRFTGLRNRQELAIGVAQGAQHWVYEEVQREPLAVHFHRHRIDEERHVVADDLDCGVGALPAVLPGYRVVSANPGLARRDLPAKGQVGRRRALEVERRARRGLLGTDLGGARAREYRDQDRV